MYSFCFNGVNIINNNNPIFDELYKQIHIEMSNVNLNRPIITISIYKTFKEVALFKNLVKSILSEMGYHKVSFSKNHYDPTLYTLSFKKTSWLELYEVSYLQSSNNPASISIL
jgi:hypothetical protein